MRYGFVEDLNPNEGESQHVVMLTILVEQQVHGPSTVDVALVIIAMIGCQLIKIHAAESQWIFIHIIDENLLCFPHQDIHSKGLCEGEHLQLACKVCNRV